MKIPSWTPLAIGAALLGALLMIFRSALGLSIVLVLLIFLVIGLMVAIVVLFRQLRQNQAAEEIERTISTQADADIEKSTPGQLVEMERLKQELLDAIATLKESKRGRGGEDALARLPWYMLIGPAGAGKSELVRRSGLHFTMQDEARSPRAVRGVGGTRGFSWWLTEEAVLLDLAGRTLATAAFDDSGEWVAFLQTLRKQRGTKPVNGAIVVIAVDQLADQPETRIDSVARAARERLEELVEHLGVVFPVYVVFNRCDQIAGFSEFFEDLETQDRLMPWGATISLERARAVAADELFDEEYGVLLAALSERRLPRMASMPDATTRARAFAFPLQLQRIRGSLRRFLRTMFEMPAGAESPPFRGFYLTSAAQQGDATDRVMQPAVRNLGLTLARPDMGGAGRGGSWFARSLFSEVVFPDAGLAVSSKGAQGRVQRGEQLVWTVAAACFVFCALLFAGFSCGNRGLVAHVRSGAVLAAERVREDTPAAERLRALEPLRAATQAVDSVSARPPLWRKLGGWSGNRVVDPAVELWTRRVAEAVLAPAVRHMEADLKRMTDTGEGRFIDYYYRFRAYRLLTTPTRIRARDAEVLGREVSSALGAELTTGVASPAERREIPTLVSRQMKFLATHPRALADVYRNYYSSADDDLVARGARRVRDTWDSSQFYQALIAEVQSSKPITLGTFVGSTTLLTGSVEVPGAFTKAGWTSDVKSRVQDLGEMVAHDWLLLDVFGGRPPDLHADVLRLYAQDYSRHWAGFLAGTSVAEPKTMGVAAEQLKLLAKGDSPLFKVLRGVCDQTRLGAAPDTPLGTVQSDFEIACAFFQTTGTSAGGRLAAFLGQFRKPAGGGDAFDKNKTASARYQAFLLAAQAKINEAAQPGAPAGNIRSLLTTGDQESNPLIKVVAFAQQLGDNYRGMAGAEPTVRLLQSPITGARQVVVGQGLNPAIAEAWSSIVLEPFRATLAGRYPFSSSEQDASLDDFTACFGPTGYVWTFYQQHLAPLGINEDGSSKTGEPPPVPGAVLDFLSKAYTIKQAFFAGGAQPALTITVRVSPPTIDGPQVNVRWVALDVGGGTSMYSMGPEQDQTLAWPGADPMAGAALRVNAVESDQGKKKKKSKEPAAVPVETRNGKGVWGLFRLLDQAQNISDTGGGANVTWAMHTPSTTLLFTYHLGSSSAHHPFRRGGLRMNPPAL